MKVQVFQVYKSCFQHAANGYLVTHSPRAFSMSLLHSLTLKMWILMPYNMPYFWQYGLPYYALLCWCRPSWKMAPCANRTHCRRCRHAVSWSHTPMIDFRHADKCLYSAANYSNTRAFFRPLLQHYNRKWPMGNQMVTWPMTSRGSKGQGHDPNTVRAQYLENSWRCYLATIANY